MQASRIAIIGAGPIGLEAALYATQLGYDVTVFEKDEVGANILEWGHVTLFSPWSMNYSALGVCSIKKHLRSWDEPGPDDYLTGKEYVQTYLAPLSKLPALEGKIHAGCRIESVGRQQLLKDSLIGDPNRAKYPFRILTTDAVGNEQVFFADIVIDSSGVYDNPNWIGEGGIPAIGEQKHKDLIDYKLIDFSGSHRSRFAGKRTLLIGSGYSAAASACDLQKLTQAEPATSVVWAIREDRFPPIPVIANDALPNRAKLTQAANSIAQNDSPQVRFRNHTSVESVRYYEDRDRFDVGLHSNGSVATIEVDRIVANVGYSPDNSIYRELQIHECYASRAPMKLSAALLGAASADCLQQTSLGADTLKNPEPNFYIIGSKSYGRNSTFLMRIGFSQITEVFSLITSDPKLNLYQMQGS